MSKYIILIGSVIAYIVIINFISNFDFGMIMQNSSYEELINQGGNIDVGVSDSVSVSVHRQRIYGDIYENNGNSKLYLMSFIPIPLKSNGMGYIKFHLIFLAVLIFITYKINKMDFNSKEKGYEEKFISC